MSTKSTRGKEGRGVVVQKMLARVRRKPAHASDAPAPDASLPEESRKRLHSFFAKKDAKRAAAPAPDGPPSALPLRQRVISGLKKFFTRPDVPKPVVSNAPAAPPSVAPSSHGVKTDAKPQGVGAQDAPKKPLVDAPAQSASGPYISPDKRNYRPSIVAELWTKAGAAFSKRSKAAAVSKAAGHAAKQDAPKSRKQAPKYKKLNRQSLQEYLIKAGYEVSADRVKRVAFQSIVSVFLLVSIIILVAGAFNSAETGDVIVFILGMWTVLFAAAVLLVTAGIYFFLDYRIYQRTKEIEDVFPDFLQLASSNISAGMPVDRALWYAIRPNFGVLAKEMEEVAKATMTGEDLEVSLTRFTDKYNSQVIKRSINILIEGMRAGGQMADLLNKIALNIEEMKIMRKEMAASVTTYAIFITFASVVIAPFLFALGTELLSIIIKIAGSINVSASSSFSFSAPSPSAIENFKIFSIAMLVTTTVFSSAIVSIIKHGRVMEGIKTMPVYAVISILIYYVALSVLHGVFGSII